MTASNYVPARSVPRSLSSHSKWKLITAGVSSLIILLTLAGSFLIGTTDKGIWVVLGSLALIGTLAIVLQPEVGLYVLVAFVYLNLSDIFKANFGIPSLIQPLVALIMVSVLANRIVISRKALVFRGTELAIFAYGLVYLLASFGASDQALSQDDFGDWIKNFIIVLIIVQLCDNEIVWKRCQWIMILSAGFLTLLSCYQIATGNYSETFLGLAKAPIHQITSGLDSNRVMGPLDDPNFYAQVLMMTLPLAAHRMLTEKNRFPRIVATICTILITAIVVMSYSRGAFLSLIIVGILILRKRRINFLKVALAAALIVVIVLPILPAGYLDRIFTLNDLVSQDATSQEDVSFKGRFSESTAAAQMFLDHPLLGVGSSNYPVHYLDYSYRLGLDDRVEMRQAHNFYLQTAAEKGIIGLVALVILIITIYASISKAKRDFLLIRRYDLISWVSGIQLGFTSYLLTSIFLHDDYNRYFWLIAGLAAGASVMSAALVRQHKAQAVEAEAPTLDFDDNAALMEPA